MHSRLVLRIMTKSVISPPICAPQPTPAVAMADGADQRPSGRRATTSPVPTRPVNTNPTLITVRNYRSISIASFES